MMNRLCHFRHFLSRRTFSSSSLMDEMFPLIMSGKEVDEKVSHELEKLGMLSHKNTLYAESTCVDEVNRDNENEDLSLIFSKRFGSVRFTRAKCWK